MSITDKTRKALWARSGNRCMICRIELVQQEAADINVIVGEECHIISKTRQGPRGTVEYIRDHDDYDNLVLLCANDHKRIDDIVGVYSVAKLRLLKTQHEEWVRSTLQRDVLAFANDKLNIKSLALVTTGKQLVNLVRGAYAFDFDHGDIRNADEASLIGGLFEELKDYGDVLSEMSYDGVINWELDLNKQIKQLGELGILLFGVRRSLRITQGDTDMGVWQVATVVAVRHDNPSIVGGFLIAKFSNKIQFNV